MNEASNRKEEELKQRVREANAACSPEYKEELKKSGGWFDDDKNLETIRSLVKAEDNLAKFQFKRDVDNEMKRIDLAIEEELKRVEELNKKREKSQDLCAACGMNIYNTLAAANKVGLEFIGRPYAKYCCGLFLCSACSKDQSNHCTCPPFANDKEIIKALKKLASQNIGWYVR